MEPFALKLSHLPVQKQHSWTPFTDNKESSSILRMFPDVIIPLLSRQQSDQHTGMMASTWRCHNVSKIVSLQGNENRSVTDNLKGFVNPVLQVILDPEHCMTSKSSSKNL